MKHRFDDQHPSVHDLLAQQASAADDALLAALGQGVDPSQGADPLAQLLLDARAEARAEIPACPDVLSLLAPGEFEELFPAASRGAAPTEVFAPVAAAPVPTAPTPEEPVSTQVIDLAAHRRRRGVSPLAAGLVGAAAATLAIAGGGAAIYNSSPGDALWGASTVLFGDHASVVELAATLEEAGDRNSQGDIAGALELLDKAKGMADEIGTKNRAVTKPAEETPVRVTVTQTETTVVTATPEPTTTSETSSAPAPTVTTVTVTAVPSEPTAVQPSAELETSVPETTSEKAPVFLDPATTTVESEQPELETTEETPVGT